jgi:hypothetical protein
MDYPMNYPMDFLTLQVSCMYIAALKGSHCVSTLSNGVENFPLKSVEKFPVILYGYYFQLPFFVA